MRNTLLLAGASIIIILVIFGVFLQNPKEKEVIGGDIAQEKVSSNSEPLTISKGTTSLNITVQMQEIAGRKYQRECLAECHLPISFKYDGLIAPSTFATDKNLFGNYLSNGERKMNYVTLEWLNISEVLEPTFEEKCTSITLPNSTKETSCNSTQNGTRVRISMEWQPVNGNLVMKKGEVYYFDFVGHDIASTEKKSIDIVPSIKIATQQFNITELAWWSSSWIRKKAIKIQNNNITYDTINASVQINVTFDSDMIVNFSDLRFTNDSENQELGYWIESKTDSSSALIWIKLPNFPKQVNTTIYMYYGNPAVDTTSSISNAFVYGDDYSSDTSGNWVNGASSLTYSASTGRLVFRQTAGASTYSYPSAAFQRLNSSYVIMAKYNFSLIGISEYMGITGFKGVMSTSVAAGKEGYCNQVADATPNYELARCQLDSGAQPFSTAKDNIDFIFDISLTELNQTVRVFNPNRTQVLINNRSDNSWSTGYYAVRLYSDNSVATLGLDWFTVRPWLSGTPTVVFGAEENPAGEEIKPLVFLDNPANGATVYAPTVSFNATLSDNYNVSNATLYVWWRGDALQNTTLVVIGKVNGTANTTYVFNKSGNYKWNYLASDNSSNRNWSYPNYTIKYVVYPFYNSFSYSVPQQATFTPANTPYQFNVTIGTPTPDNEIIDKVILEWNGTNYTASNYTAKTFNVTFTSLALQNFTYYWWVNYSDGGGNNLSQMFEYNLSKNVLTEINQTYNTSSYETAGEGFILTLDYLNPITELSAVLRYNNSDYAGTKTNDGVNVNFTANANAPNVITPTAVPFYWIITQTNASGSFYYNTTSKTQSVLPFQFGFCNTTLNVTYLNVTFKNETIATEKTKANMVSNFVYYSNVPSANKTYSFSNASENYEYDYCFSPTHLPVYTYVTFQYDNAETDTRVHTTTYSLSNKTSNITLWVLPFSASYIYVTFQVTNTADQPLSGVTINVTHPTLGLIETKTTSVSGTATFLMNPTTTYTISTYRSDLGSYSFSDTFATSSYTIMLGTVNSTPYYDYTTGITYSIRPGDSALKNNTVYHFNFTVASTYWEVSKFGFILYYENGTVAGSTSAVTNGGTVDTTANTGNKTNSIRMNAYYVINNTYRNVTMTWYVAPLGDTSFSILYLITDLDTFLSRGLLGINEFSLALLGFVIILLVSGVFAVRYGLNNPHYITGIIFVLTFFFDVVMGWFPVRLGAITYMPTILTGIIFMIFAYREVGR